MSYEISFATCEEEEQLLDILLDSNMEIAGDIQDHVVIRNADEVIGGGMLTATSKDEFHLIVFAVKETVRGSGIGKQLISALINEPWLYCRDCETDFPAGYRITTVAKGESSPFYGKVGFTACDFSELADPFSEQCIGCPDITACTPVAMVYTA
jgi:N-acetylglutamate synthase-like GNAT family acetyltransferase